MEAYLKTGFSVLVMDFFADYDKSLKTNLVKGSRVYRGTRLHINFFAKVIWRSHEFIG